MQHLESACKLRAAVIKTKVSDISVIETISSKNMPKKRLANLFRLISRIVFSMIDFSLQRIN